MQERLTLGLVGGGGAAAVAAAVAAAAGADGARMLVAVALAAALGWFAARSAITAHDPGGQEVVAPIANAALLDAIDEPLLLIEGRRVIEANQAARALLGRHVVGEDARMAIRHPAATAMLTGDDADPRPIALTGLGEADRRWELAVTPLDAGRRLARLADRSLARDAERMRMDFVANASHELRTPLSTLLGFIETLEDQGAGGDLPTRQRFLGIMMGEAKRMQRLVDDLLSLSRIEGDRHVPPRENIDLAQLAHEVRDAASAGQEPDRIRVEAEASLPPVTGDRAQLGQVLHNLVGNALKYGGVGEPVTIALARDGPSGVRITVTDRGEGIAPEHLPRLTERFYRVDPGRSRAAGGTGLGLAIVKHIVERHRGRLEIASTRGVGSTMSVTLPAALSS